MYTEAIKHTHRVGLILYMLAVCLLIAMVLLWIFAAETHDVHLWRAAIAVTCAFVGIVGVALYVFKEPILKVVTPWMESIRAILKYLVALGVVSGAIGIFVTFWIV